LPHSTITVEQATQEGWYRPNTNGGYCHCGCGEKTTLSQATNRKAGTILGHPQRFINGHSNRLYTQGCSIKVDGSPCGQKIIARGMCSRHYQQLWKPEAKRSPITINEAIQEGWYQPNTNDGLCHCGCGKRTPIADKTSKRNGTFKGLPCRFCHGHAGRQHAKDAECDDPTCPESRTAGPYCRKHYNRWYKHGDTGILLKVWKYEDELCPVEVDNDVCGKPAKKQGMCHAHYETWLGGSRASQTSMPLPKIRPCPGDKCTRNYRASTGYGCCAQCVKKRNPGQRKRSLEERLEYHIFKPDGPTGCWLWNGFVTPSRIPLLSWKGERINVRRYFHDDPGKAEVRRCTHNANCVNPLHTMIQATILIMDVITLRKQGLSLKTIARQLDTSVSHISVTLSDARTAGLLTEEEHRAADHRRRR
jgi:hypothetical protein